MKVKVMSSDFDVNGDNLCHLGKLSTQEYMKSYKGDTKNTIACVCAIIKQEEPKSETSLQGAYM